MTISCTTLVLGPLENNTYLIADQETGQAVVVDPSFESEQVLEEALQHGWTLSQVWLTHAHFDHIAGVATVCGAFAPPLPVGLHPGDLALWQQNGGASNFGLQVERGPEPTILFSHGQLLTLGRSTFQVRHTPGHTRGHVVFVSQDAPLVLCGDLIFKESVGRTDLPNGNPAALLASIRTQILTLPPETRLLSGHGPETTVGYEAKNNPFI